MIVTTKIRKLGHRSAILLCLIVISCSVILNVYAQDPPKKKAPTHRSISSSMPSGYSQVGTTDLIYQKKSTAIDIQGLFNGNYYGSTYSNNGYRVAMQVGSNGASEVNCQNGGTYNGVEFSAEMIAQGELGRVCYYITNTNTEDVTISLGIHADVMIGNNDRAPIVRKIDTIGNSYGLALLDGNGAQLCVLFGSGLPGVTGVDDFWFGYYNLNRSASAMVGNYSSGSNYMVENGSYDSGMGWCWKNRTIPAGETVIFSWLIGVGDVNLEPNSNFEVTPEDPDGWNDLTRLHVLAMQGDYESPAGLSGKIQYAIEESEDWIDLTEMLESGSTFQDTVRAMFDPTLANHTIRFRTVDQVGNTSLLPSIVYPDVSFRALEGIVDKTYTGDSIFQSDLTCELDENRYELKSYRNNVNVGIASFNMEGVFPYTIGRRTYTFNIVPQPLAGELAIEGTFVYDGQPKTPAWTFTEEAYDTLRVNRDYTVTWSNNTLPGEATLTVTGQGNYTNVLTKTFFIDKAQLDETRYTVTLPAEDISYDAQPHAATVVTEEGVGTATISYMAQGSDVYTTDAPVAEGAYDIILTIDEGTLYYGMERTKIGRMTIYSFSATEWACLQGLYTQIAASNPEWAQKWQAIISNTTAGILSVGQLEGVIVEKGHVVGFDFVNESLVGQFPSMLLTFPQTKVLDLTGNSLTGDIATVIQEVYAYILQYDPTFESQLETLNITGNKLTGNIGLLAASNETVSSLLTHFPNLTTLWASGNSFTDVYPHLPATILNLDLTNQVMDVELNIDLSNFDANSLINQIPTLFVYNHQEQSYNTTVTARLSNYPPTATTADYTAEKPYWGVDAFMLNDELGLTCLTGNTYKGESGDILYVSYPIATEEVSGSYCYTKYHFSQGDVNFVGGIDLLDLQATINYIFGNYNTYPFNFTAADTYKDGRLNVQDVVCTANIIMDAESAPAPSLANAGRKAPAQDGGEADAYLSVRDGKVILYTTVPIASFDMTFEGSPNLEFSLESRGYDVMSRQQAATSRYLGYTLSEQYIPVGETVIAEYSGDTPVIRYAVLSDQEAQHVRVSFVSETTSIGHIAGTDAESEYYSPSGIRLEKPVKGINIVKIVNADGTSSSKVVYIK